MHEDRYDNLVKLSRNRYPGRGIVVGLNDTGQYLVQAYWIMGRSENSRNRVFEKDDNTGRVFTVAADPAKIKDPSLIIYNAMLERKGCFAVSNGHQTDTIVDADKSFFAAMQAWKYEPDAPNHTPRISAVCHLKNRIVAEMAILRKSPWSDACDRHLYSFEELGKGLGFCITTYSEDGDPLPAFRGEPYLLPLEGNIEVITGTLWSALDSENRVSLAVKFINRTSGASAIRIVNKYAKI